MEKRSALIAGFISVTVLAFILTYGAMTCLDPIRFPIQQVYFIGEPHSISSGSLEEVMGPYLSSGFLRLKVTDLQGALLSLPWMKQIDIQKEWPNKLVIKFGEHQPAAKWKQSGMISSTGEFFFPKEPLFGFDDLPQLEGPNARRTLVWQHYLAMQAILSPHELRIANLILAPRGAWQIKLNNGVMIHLGTNDVIKRLKRFVRAYETHLQSKHKAMKYVDLRYTRGLAVGWKPG